MEEREPKAYGRRRSHLLTELAHGCLLIRLPDADRASDAEFVLPWKAGGLPGTPTHEKATWPIPNPWPTVLPQSDPAVRQGPSVWPDR